MSFSVILSQEKFIQLESRVFPDDLKEDGMWSAISAASDGKVYIGLSTYGNSAHLYIYDPKMDEVRHVADLAEILGEKGNGVRTNAKIHTPFVEAADGRIYFASGSMGHGPRNVDPRTWEGGHWWSYDPKADQLKDLGVVRPYEGIYALVIDRKRKKLYGTSAWGHFIIYDIESGETIDKDRVNNLRTVCRTMVIDDQGNVYGSYESYHVFRYDPDKDCIVELTIEFPTDKTVWPVDWNTFRSNWRSVVWDEKSRKIYGIDRTSSLLFQYDPKVGDEGEMTPLIQLCAKEYVDNKIVPYSTLAFTLGNDRNVYYAPVAKPFDYIADISFVGGGVTGSYHYTHLVSYDLNKNLRKDHGIMKVEENAMVLGVGGATTAPDGTIYFCGAVQEKDENKVAGKAGGVEPFSMRLIIFKP
jgi:hypothetical protein